MSIPSHSLIELTQWPSMPAPFNSSDPGEAWVWGDYVVLLQTKPMSMAEVLAKMAREKGVTLPPFEYPYVATVFYRKDKNPHGPSNRPIFVATLERLNYAAAEKIAREKGLDPSLVGIPQDNTIIQGLFTAETRLNLGEFTGNLTVDSARDYFLNLVGKRLSLEGEPVKIGAIQDIHGHPNTGWPAQPKKKTGCLALVAAAAFLAIPAFVLFIQSSR